MESIVWSFSGRETRGLARYICICTRGNSQVFMQTASSVSRRCTNHVECTFFNLSSCLLSPLFLFLFQTSPRHLGKMCPRAHHRLHLCTHGYVFATRPRIPVEDRHTHTHTRVSFSLFRSFFCSLTRDTRTRSFCNDRINRGNRCFVSPRNDHVCLSSIDSSSNAILFPNVIRGKVNAIESINDNNQSSLSRIFFV